MNTIVRAAAGAAMLTVLADGALAQMPTLPPAPNCAEVAATHSTFWEGRFSGTYDDGLFEDSWPVAAHGCFETEFACRRWVNQIQTIVINPAFMSCRLKARR